jgi:hypothetical protein
MTSDADAYDQSLDAYRRLIERASRAVHAAVEDEPDEGDGILDPDPCP